MAAAHLFKIAHYFHQSPPQKTPIRLRQQNSFIKALSIALYYGIDAAAVGVFTYCGPSVLGVGVVQPLVVVNPNLRACPGLEVQRPEHTANLLPLLSVPLLPVLL